MQAQQTQDMLFNPMTLGDAAVILKVWFSNSISRRVNH